MSKIQLHRNEVGIASSFEMAIRFSVWAESMGSRLTRQAIEQHWKVSRATAYRWLNSYRAAVGISA